ncbi:hypothetical protein [Maridesulfovibrio sp. FT414]|uniref:hypothetical protein n=1 Tax=Maridesulfovibrio sp. FT414 TaxID=2979469 RepID=UPI003D8089F4
MSTIIPYIYVEFKGDLSALEYDMGKARSIVRRASEQMTSDLKKAVVSSQLSGEIKKISDSLKELSSTSPKSGTACRALKGDLIGMKNGLGLVADEYARLGRNMIQPKAFEQSARGLLAIAKAANTASVQTAELYKRLGVTMGGFQQFDKVSTAVLKKSYDNLVAVQKKGGEGGRYDYVSQKNASAKRPGFVEDYLSVRPEQTDAWDSMPTFFKQTALSLSAFGGVGTFVAREMIQTNHSILDFLKFVNYVSGPPQGESEKYTVLINQKQKELDRKLKRNKQFIPVGVDARGESRSSDTAETLGLREDIHRLKEARALTVEAFNRNSARKAYSAFKGSEEPLQSSGLNFKSESSSFQTGMEQMYKTVGEDPATRSMNQAVSEVKEDLVRLTSAREDASARAVVIKAEEVAASKAYSEDSLEHSKQVLDDLVAAASVSQEEWTRIEEDGVQQRKEILDRAAEEQKENDFFGGLKSGFQEVVEENKTMSERGIDLAKDFASGSKSALSDVGFDFLTGKMKSFSDYWNSFWGGLGRSVMDHLADLAVNKGLGMLADFGGGLFDMAGSFFTNIWHTGNIDLAADEVAAVLQQGEMVIPARHAEVIRQSVSSNGVSKSQYFDTVTDFVSVGKQRSLADSINNTSRDLYGWDMLKAAGGAAFSGLTKAFANWQMVGNVASSLRNQGVNVSGSAVSNLQWDSALSGFTSTFFPGFAGNMFGSFGNRMLGMNDNAYNVLGFDVDSATVGNVISSAALLLLGGPAASLATGVLSPLVSLGISGLADLLDLRENETIRDALDDKLGFLASRIAYQNIQHRIGKNGMVTDQYTLSTKTAPASGPYSYVNGVYWSENWFTAEQIASIIADEFEFANSLASDRSVESALAKSYRYGNAYTAYVIESDDEAQKTALAKAIGIDPGYFGYTAREFAAHRTGVGFEFGEDYYSPTDGRIARSSMFNPNSDAAKAMGSNWVAAVRACETYTSLFDAAENYSLGYFGGIDISPSTYSMPSFEYDLDWSSLDMGRDFTDFVDSIGSNSSETSPSSEGADLSGDPDSGYGAENQNSPDYSGYDTPGRRHGGPVTAGRRYIWQEAGLPGEIFIPQTNGYVMDHEDSSRMINALWNLVDERKYGGDVRYSGDSATVVNLHLDGQQFASAIVPGLREQSRNGVQFVHADTLIEVRA